MSYDFDGKSSTGWGAMVDHEFAYNSLGLSYDPLGNMPEMSNPYYKFGNNPARLSVQMSHMRTIQLWSEYFFLTNPYLNSAVYMRAVYPVRRPKVMGKGKGHDELERIMRTSRLLQALIEHQLNKIIYGYSVILNLYPMRKFLICPRCGAPQWTRTSQWEFSNYRFILKKCGKCGSSGEAQTVDRYVPSEGIVTTAWNPMDTLIHNSTAVHPDVYIRPTKGMRRSLMLGLKSVAESTPKALIDAARTGKLVKIDPARVRVGMRYGVGGHVAVPGTMTALKASQLWELSMAANEALASEQTFPMDIFYPAATKSTDVASFLNYDLQSWKQKLEIELARHSTNPRHKAVMPFPVGVSRAGESARVLFTSEILQHLAQEISVAVGSALDMVMGKMTYSGGNIRLRFLENVYDVDADDLQEIINWWADEICYFRKLPPTKVELPKVKMADDLARTNMLLQLYDRKLASGADLQHAVDLDGAEVRDRQQEELNELMVIDDDISLHKAETQGKVQVIGAQYNGIVQAIQQKKGLQTQAEMIPLQSQIQQAQQAQQMQQQVAQQQSQLPPQGQQQQGAPQQGQPTPEQQMPQGVRSQAGQMREGVDPEAVVMSVSKQLMNMDRSRRTEVLSDMRRQSPMLHSEVMRRLGISGGAGEKHEPLPEQRAPRREGAKRLV